MYGMRAPVAASVVGAVSLHLLLERKGNERGLNCIRREKGVLGVWARTVHFCY